MAVAVVVIAGSWFTGRDGGRAGSESRPADVLTQCMAEIDQSDVPMIAVGTTLLPANECTIEDDRVVANHVSSSPLVGAQTIEYLLAFFLSRPAMASHNILPFVSGGFGLFSREAILAVNGFAPDHLGEDLDFCIRLHRHYIDNQLPYTVSAVPEAIVWTEVPTTLAQLRQQRLQRRHLEPRSHRRRCHPGDLSGS